MSRRLTDKKIGLGPRIGQFLRATYPANRAKSVAADFSVSTGTAKRWLRGISPTPAIIEEMASRWGVEFVAAVFADYIIAGDRDATILVELIKVRDQLQSDMLSQIGPKLRTEGSPEWNDLEDSISELMHGAMTVGGPRIRASDWRWLLQRLVEKSMSSKEIDNADRLRDYSQRPGSGRSNVSSAR